MTLSPPRVWLAAWLLAVSVLAGCAAPPQKELDQAQSAIDAAVAEGAERFAAAEVESARDAVRRANEAVAQRDYKLALANALDGRERAQAAARTTTEARARLRTEVERALAVAGAQLAREQRAAAALRPRAAGTQARRAAVSKLESALQEASAAAAALDFEKARGLLDALMPRLEPAAGAAGGTATQSPRRRR